MVGKLEREGLKAMETLKSENTQIDETVHILTLSLQMGICEVVMDR